MLKAIADDPAINAAFRLLVLTLLASAVGLIAHLRSVVMGNGGPLAPTVPANQPPTRIGLTPKGRPITSRAVVGGTTPGPGPLGVPVSDQTSELLPDLQLDPYWATDCGETCISDLLMAYGFPRIPAGVIRTQLGSQAAGGYTTAEALCAALKLYGVPADPYRLDGTQLMAWLQDMFTKKEGGIVLGRWISPSLLHWRVPIRADRQGVLWNETWGGIQLSTSWSDVLPRYEGTLVRVHRALK